jgi:hypothetical protein
MGFELAFPASERSQMNTDGAATRISGFTKIDYKSLKKWGVTTLTGLIWL